MSCDGTGWTGPQRLADGQVNLHAICTGCDSCRFPPRWAAFERRRDVFGRGYGRIIGPFSTKREAERCGRDKFEEFDALRFSRPEAAAIVCEAP